MAQALNYIYQIYAKFLDLVFNQFQMFNGVTIGWVMVSTIVFGLLINSILNLPKGVHFHGRNTNNRND